MDIGDIDLDGAIQHVLKNAAACHGLYKGLHECTKAIEQRKAICCFLAENCDDKTYSCLVEALCKEHEIPIIKIPDNKRLGELAGLCKYDKEGKARKIVSSSCIVVKDIGEESRGWKYLVEKYNIPVSDG